MYRRRVPFIADASLYKDYYRGGNLPVFRGVYQDGSGILGSFFRSAIPILKPILASVGKTLLSTGATALNDVLTGESNIKTALKKRGVEGLKTVGRDLTERALKKLKTRQEGGRRQRRRNVNTPRKRKQSVDIFDKITATKPKRRCKRN